MKTFKETTELDPKTVLIIDALNLGFRWKHSKAEVFADEYIYTVKSLQKSYKAKTVIIACDEGSSSYRKSIFPEYKANRQALRDAQTEQDKLDFEVFIAEFLRTIELLKEHFIVLKYAKTEADDIAAYLVSKLKKSHSIWLASSDKDWDLLVDLDVSRFSYVTRKETTIDNWDSHYSFSPEQYISIKCLTGDSGDGIPGVPGIGPVKALDLVNKYGSTYDIIASIPIDSKYKYIQNLNAFGADKLLLNYKLMDLVSYCEEAIGKDNIADINSKIKELLEY